MPDTQTQIDFLDSLPAVITDMRREEIAEILTDMSHMNRRPDVLREFNAIQALIEAGRTIPQISVTFDIPESVIIARLRIGHLHEDLRALLTQNRLSVSLAQRLAAESVQTQTRIAREFFEQHPFEGSDRLTTSIAYPEQAADVQTSLEIASASDVLAHLTEEQRAEFLDGFLHAMQPDDVRSLLTRIPSQTVREVVRRVYQTSTTVWVDLAEQEIPRHTQLILFSRLLMAFPVAQTISGLIPRAQTRLTAHFQNLSNEQLAAAHAEIQGLHATLAEARTERNTLAIERDAFRAQLDALRAQRPATPVVEEPGRAYRETLQGPSDDPSETGATSNAATAESGAQFDYPASEESWELVVNHLTDAADAMPLSPSDASDRFHHDIEALRTRAIVQQREENANAGVVSGRVIPPSAPAPAPANSGRVRTHAQRAVEHVRGAPSTLDEHARLLAEQAEQINANTTRHAARAARAAITDVLGRPFSAARPATATEIEAARSRHVHIEREARENAETAELNRPSGAARSQQEILDASRVGRVADGTIVEIMRDGTLRRVDPNTESVDVTPPRRTRTRRPNV